MSTPTMLFIALAGTLAVLAIGYVLRPLWQRTPAAGTGIVVALVVLAGTLYTVLGTPGALDPAARTSAEPQSMEAAITALEAQLARDPSQAEGWRLLANAYASIGESGKVQQAYARAVQAAPDDPDLLVEAAENRAMAAEGRRFDAEGVKMLEHAVAVQPMHQRGRWFLGIARRQAGDAAGAAAAWEPLLQVVDARTAAPLHEQIALARADAGLPPLPELPAVPVAPGVTVSVSLDPALGMQLPQGATLFVIARQPDGPPMPVAVQRLPLTQLPLTVSLTDADSPMPTAKLSQLPEVELVARISASGNAMPATGDFTSQPVRVKTGEGAKAALLIDAVVR